MIQPRVGVRALMAVLVAACVGSPSVVAQTRPKPQLPAAADAPPSDDPNASSPTAEPLRSWIYSLGLGMGWESNVGLRPEPTVSDFGGVLHAAASRKARTSKGELSFSSGLRGYLYNEQTDYNSLNGQLSLHGEQRLASTATGSLDLGFVTDQTYNMGLLLDQGAPLPATRAFNFNGTAQLSLQTSPADMIRLSVQGDRVSYPESELLRDGSRLRLTADLERRLSGTNSLVLEYSAELSDAALPAAEPAGEPTGDPGGEPAGASAEATWLWTHYISGQWRHRLSSRSSMVLEAGASYTQEAEQAGLARQANFFGGGGLEYSAKRTSLALYYRREVLPVFGTGELRLTDRFGLNLQLPIGERWVSILGGSYSTGAMQAGGERQATTHAYANGNLRVSGRWWLVVNGRYFQQSAVGATLPLEDVRAAALVVLAAPGSTPSVTPWR